MIPAGHATTAALGRAAAKRALDQALAVLSAWYDEARIRTCVVCLGVFVRPVGARQGRRIYCSDPCRQLARRLCHPQRSRRAPRPALPLLDQPEQLA